MRSIAFETPELPDGRLASGVVQVVVRDELLARVTPLRVRTTERCQQRRHVRVARARQGPRHLDVGVCADVEHTEQLGDELLAVVEGVDDRRVRLLATQHRGAAHRGEIGALRTGPACDAHLDDTVAALGLRSARRHRREQDGGEHRVVRAVVDVARAERGVLDRADEGVLQLRRALTTVGDGHLVGGLVLGVEIAQEQHLEADLTCRVLEAEGTHLAQVRLTALGLEPALRRHPRREQFELAG